MYCADGSNERVYRVHLLVLPSLGWARNARGHVHGQLHCLTDENILKNVSTDHPKNMKKGVRW